MNASVFIGTSVDGFIARLNGDFDFLPADGGEPHGYAEFMETVDALVIGRKTYETVLAFKTWPYGEKPVLFSALARSPRRRLMPLSSICQETRPKLPRNSKLAASIMSMLTAA